MRRLYSLLVLAPLVLAGCIMDLPGNLARNQTVKSELPPEIDPKMPPAYRTDINKPPTEQSVGEPSKNGPAVAPKVRFDLPITADQVTPANPFDAGRALRQELDQDDMLDNGPSLAPSRGNSPKTTR